MVVSCKMRQEKYNTTIPSQAFKSSCQLARPHRVLLNDVKQSRRSAPREVLVVANNSLVLMEAISSHSQMDPLSILTYI